MSKSTALTRYTIETVLEGVERVASTEGKLQYRLKTEDGTFITKADIPQANRLTAESRGAVALTIEDNRVVSWVWILLRRPKKSVSAN